MPRPSGKDRRKGSGKDRLKDNKDVNRDNLRGSGKVVRRDSPKDSPKDNGKVVRRDSRRGSNPDSSKAPRDRARKDRTRMDSALQQHPPAPAGAPSSPHRWTATRYSPAS